MILSGSGRGPLESLGYASPGRGHSVVLDVGLYIGENALLLLCKLIHEQYDTDIFAVRQELVYSVDSYTVGEAMTQLQILADALDRGERLTVAVALEKYGVYALSQRMGELSRKWNYPVESRTVETPTGKHIKEYSRGKIAYG